jgi:aminoglycoside N3'-acetyltransferase
MAETPLAKDFRRLLSPYANKPVMIHSDLFSAMPFVERTADRQKLLNNHLATLQDAISPKNIWMPAFNYQYTKTRFFSVKESPCELGPLNEYYRTIASHRTLDPIFSFCSNQEIALDAPVGQELRAFSPQTAFFSLVKSKGAILFYGAPFTRLTMIHHVESRSGGPVYRYDKTFIGKVERADGTVQDLRYIYHVRPASQDLEYDWERLQSDLTAQGILKCMPYKTKNIAMLIDADNLLSYWLEKIKHDPFYLIDAASRAWAEPLVKKLGRRLTITDFEKEEK